MFAPSASLENLRQRAALLHRIRHFFDSQTFIEVQTPVLSTDTVVDRFIEPLSVSCGNETFYFRTSPEFAMKRLLAASLDAIYEIAPVFRQGDRGQFHNPEFTMLEWYRAGDDYQDGRALLAKLIQNVASTVCPLVQSSFQEVFETHTGLNPHRTTAEQCRTLAVKRKVSFPASFEEDEDIEAWMDLLFSELVQPELKNVIVYDYPAFQSQLARTRTENGITVSERFELFLNGIEIANGYHELLDAAELRLRFEETNRQRLAAGKQALPVESKLLEAMEHGLPPCSGTALGVDRLLMVLLKAATIDDVIAFPIRLS
jgi:lysyl-tRNA synthetase class 2